MNSNIEKILADVYLFEPELKTRETALVVLIEELLHSKPDTKFDETFAHELRKRILAQPIPINNIRRWPFSLKQNPFAVGGFATALVLLLVVVMIKQNNFSMFNRTSSNVGQITHLANNAFGSLSAGQPVATLDKTASVVTPSANTMIGLGGGSPEGATQTLSAPVAYGMGGGVTGKMIRPYPYIRYTYVYKGEPLNLTDSMSDVYMRAPVVVDTGGLLASLNPFAVNGLDVSSFVGSNVTSFEVTQNTTDGYIVNVNIGQGTASINQNWQMWQQPNCINGICEPPTPLKESDIPNDSEVIGIANDFLQAHHINTTNFATPEINNTWRVPMMKGETSLVAYIPDVMTILYPQKVNGAVLYDMNGNKIGMSVSMDIRRRKVTGVWNITDYHYQSSAYAVETDAKKIIAIAERGGIYGSAPYYYGEAGKNQTITLDTPTRVLVTTWQNTNNESKEIIVPALFFPVIDSANNLPDYFTKGVVVPLIQEVLKQDADVPVAVPFDTTAPAVRMLK